MKTACIKLISGDAKNEVGNLIELKNLGGLGELCALCENSSLQEQDSQFQ